MTENAVAFNKISARQKYSGIWAFSGAWGKIICGDNKFKFICLGDNLEIKKIAFADSGSVTEINYNGEKIAFKLNKTQIEFDSLLKIEKDGVLTILVEENI